MAIYHKLLVNNHMPFAENVNVPVVGGKSTLVLLCTVIVALVAVPVMFCWGAAEPAGRAATRRSICACGPVVIVPGKCTRIRAQCRLSQSPARSADPSVLLAILDPLTLDARDIRRANRRLCQTTTTNRGLSASNAFQSPLQGIRGVDHCPAGRSSPRVVTTYSLAVAWNAVHSSPCQRNPQRFDTPRVPCQRQRSIFTGMIPLDFHLLHHRHGQHTGDIRLPLRTHQPGVNRVK